MLAAPSGRPAVAAACPAGWQVTVPDPLAFLPAVLQQLASGWSGRGMTQVMRFSCCKRSLQPGGCRGVRSSCVETRRLDTRALRLQFSETLSPEPAAAGPCLVRRGHRQ